MQDYKPIYVKGLYKLLRYFMKFDRNYRLQYDLDRFLLLRILRIKI